MSILSGLIDAARLSPALHKIKEASEAAKAAAEASGPAKVMQYADVPPGKEFPGLNRVETADLANQVVQYKQNFGVDKIDIPMFAGPDKPDWAPIYQTVKRSNEGSWWGRTTGDVGYDRIANDDLLRNKNQLQADVIRMTPDDYIDIVNDFPDKNKNIDSIQVARLDNDPSAYADAVAGNKADIDAVAQKMIAEGNQNMPVLDYTKSSRDGLLRAYAAKQLGIKDMPVFVVRSNAPAETHIVKSDADIYSALSVREGTRGEKPADRFGHIETGFNPDTNTVQIKYSKLNPKYQGRGLGLEMYERLISKVMKDKHILASDKVLSPEGYRVWQSLAKRGYRLRRNPNVNEIKVGHEIGFHSADGQPIFTVIAEPKATPIPVKPTAKKTAKDIAFANKQLAIQKASQDAMRRAQALKQKKATSVKGPEIKVEPKAATVRPGSDEAQALKGRQATEFAAWLDKQQLPPGYDKRTLLARSLDNASDVPADQVFAVAKDTAYQYIDDIEMAREADIAPYGDLMDQPHQPQQALHMGGQEIPTQDVYHGTGARFDKFSWDKIGSGEGAQVIAYGHYVAESPNIAAYYERTVGGSAPISIQDLQEYFTPGSIITSSYTKQPDKVISFNYNPEDSRSAWSVTVQHVDKNGQPTEPPRTHRTMPDKQDVQAVLGRKLSYRYKVEAPHRDELLDWHENITKQKPALIQKLKENFPDYFDESVNHYTDILANEIDATADEISRLKKLKDQKDLNTPSDEKSPEYNKIKGEIRETSGKINRLRIRESVLQDMVDRMLPLGDTGNRLTVSDIFNAKRFYRDMSDRFMIRLLDTPKYDHITSSELQPMAADMASKALFKAGIPGVSYIGAASGARNMVIFDDSLLNIKEVGAIGPKELVTTAAIGAAATAASQHKSNK